MNSKMNNSPKIEDIDPSILTGLVRKALNSSSVQIDHWVFHQLSYIKTEQANLGLYRFQGNGHDQGKSCSWSIILKAVRESNHTDPAFWNNHRREILAYQSGLLADLPGGISAPRYLGLQEHPNDVFWLWLEDLPIVDTPTWRLTDYRTTACFLGQFNGAYLVDHPLPDYP